MRQQNNRSSWFRSILYDLLQEKMFVIFPKYREIFPAAKKEHGFCCIFPFSFFVFHDSALAHSRLKHVKPIPASRSMSCWTKITRHRPYDLSIALHLYASLPVVVISESGGSSNYQSKMLAPASTTPPPTLPRLLPGACRWFFRLFRSARNELRVIRHIQSPSLLPSPPEPFLEPD